MDLPSRRVFSYPHGSERKVFVEGFSVVRMEVNENMFQGFSMTNEKQLRKTKCVSNDRSRHDDSNGYKFCAILGGGKRPFKV